MSAEQRLSAIVTGLRSVGVGCLVMGGHAARFYGVQRTTIDFDLHVAPDCWDDLAARLAKVALFACQPVTEGNSWRPGAFRRFQIGRLPDGREEWLEFWRENHLLAPFPQLFARREVGPYGGAELAFLSLPDLIRSKETERAVDWADVELLEEILDARHVGRVHSGTMAPAEALAGLRSRTGLEAFLQGGYLQEAGPVAVALAQAAHPVTQALLLPFAPTASAAMTTPPVEPVVLNRLRGVAPLGPLHLALVEAVRRQYRAYRQAADRADKEAIRARQYRPG